MTSTADHFFSTITETVRQLRVGTILCLDLVESCLERELATRKQNAFTEVFADEARQVAKALQTLLDSGYDLGPLHGIPIALKANIALKNKKMTAGSRILADNIPSADATVAARLRKAGAVLLGFTNMHEFAWGGTTANPHYGICRNAWDSERIPAGSSGGSGVVVAAGSALASLGTDTGGSIRLPASMNGVTGLRPTVGRISVDGIFPLAVSMDTVGPLARSSEDCALIFQAMSAPGDRDQIADELRGLTEGTLGGRTIGLVSGYGGEDVQPDIAAAFEEMIRTFERAGARVVTKTFEGLDFAVDAQVIVDAAEPTTVHDRWLNERADDYGNDVRAQLLAGRAFSAPEYLHAQRYRTFVRKQFDRAFDDVDIILTPTLPFTAPKIGQDWIMIGDREESTLTGNMKFTSLPSLAALPALSVPMGFDRDGLPIGAQLIGASQEEPELLRFGHIFQTLTDFHLRRPG